MAGGANKGAISNGGERTHCLTGASGSTFVITVHSIDLPWPVLGIRTAMLRCPKERFSCLSPIRFTWGWTKPIRFNDGWVISCVRPARTKVVSFKATMAATTHARTSALLFANWLIYSIFFQMWEISQFRTAQIALAGITILIGGCQSGNEENPGDEEFREAVELRGVGFDARGGTSKGATAFVVGSDDMLSLVEKWDFSSGSLQGWEVIDSRIPSVTWQIDSDRGNALGTQSLYFGNLDARNYNEGHVFATLRSPQVQVPSKGPSFFDIEAYVDCERFPQWVNYDNLDLYVISNTTTRKWRQRLEPDLGNTEGRFVRFRSGDLDDFAGQEVRFELRFDSVDHLFNAHEGVYIAWAGLTFDDGDGVGLEDNCPLVADLDQTDTDGDGKGDPCDKVDCTEAIPCDHKSTVAKSGKDLLLLRNCSSLDGSLHIRYVYPEPNLGGLECLQSVRYLEIGSNVMSLDGLDGLRSIEFLQIRRNHSLTNLHGLKNVTFIGGMSIYENHSLTSLDGLQNQTSFGQLEIRENDALESLDGLENVASVSSSLNIRDNGVLASVDGLVSLISVGGDVHEEGLIINNNPSLGDLGGLKNLMSVSGSLEILANDALVGLNGLQNLTEVGELRISGNGGLADLDGLENLTTIRGDLLVLLNDVLTSLRGLENVKFVEGLRIFKNPLLANLSGLEGISSAAWVTVRENDALMSVSGLEGLTAVEGDLSIEANRGLRSLSDFQNLRSVGKKLSIRGNDMLTSFSGLENVSSALEGLTIAENDQLASLTGLENVPSVAGGLQILSNSVIKNLNGLNGLRSAGVLSVIRNDFLESLSGLENLTFIDQLHMNDNDALTSIAALRGITSIGRVYIQSNDALMSLSGLENVTAIGGEVTLWGNSSLTHLNELKNITTVDGMLRVWSSALVDLSGLSHVTSIGGDLDISHTSALMSLGGLASLKSIGGKVKFVSNKHLSSCEVEAFMTRFPDKVCECSANSGNGVCD